MKMLKWVMLSVLLFAAPARGADIVVMVEDNPVPMYSYGVISVKLEPGDLVNFKIYPKPVKRTQKEGTLFLAGQPGKKFTIFIDIVNFGEKPEHKKRFDSGEVEVTFAGEDEGGGEDEDVPQAATLTSKVKSAFKLDPAVEQLLAPKLAIVYGKAVTLSTSATTWGDLFAQMNTEATLQGVTGKLLNTQEAVQAYLLSHLPSKEAWDKPILAKDRKKAKDAFTVVANALGKLK